MALVRKDSLETKLFETEARKVRDPTGAGDTAIATFAFFCVQGKSIEEAAELANKAAGIAVSKVGCYQVKLKELIDSLN